MVIRFITGTLARPCTAATDAIALVTGAARSLRNEYPALNARLLDYAIWEHQRRQPKLKTDC